MVIRHADGVLQIAVDGVEARKVVCDIFARLLLRDAEIDRQAVVADAVDNAEIDRLGALAQLGRHCGEGDAEDGGRRRCVNVLAREKGVYHRFVARDVREQAQLNL